MIKKINRINTLIATTMGTVMIPDKEKKYTGYKRLNTLLFHKICILGIVILIAATAKWIFSPDIQIERIGHVWLVIVLVALVESSYFFITSSPLWRNIGWLFGSFGFVGFVLITILLTGVQSYIHPDIPLSAIFLEVFKLVTNILLVIFIWTSYLEQKWENKLSKRDEEREEKKKESEYLAKRISQSIIDPTKIDLKTEVKKWYEEEKDDLIKLCPNEVERLAIEYLEETFPQLTEDDLPGDGTIRKRTTGWLGKELHAQTAQKK